MYVHTSDTHQFVVFIDLTHHCRTLLKISRRPEILVHTERDDSKMNMQNWELCHTHSMHHRLQCAC